MFSNSHSKQRVAVLLRVVTCFVIVRLSATFSLRTFSITPHHYFPHLCTTASSSSSYLNSCPRAWIVPEGVSFGSLDKLKFEKIPNYDNDSANNENCVKDDDSKELLAQVSTKAIGLNFADIFCVLGLYSAANAIRGTAAFCPGLEFAGVVQIDPTNTFQKGDRVLGFRRFGAYSDLVSVPPAFLYPLPSNWTYIQGASFLVQALTAWHGLVEIGRMPIVAKKQNKGKKKFVALIHSAAGGVGLWASEIAARRGAIVVGVVGNADKSKIFEERILPLSPSSRTIIRGDENTFGTRLTELLLKIHKGTKNEDNIEIKNNNNLQSLRENGNGVDVVMESLGGKYFTESFESLNSGGALVTFGSTSYVSPGIGLGRLRLIWRYLTRPFVDPGSLTSRNVQIGGFNLIYLTNNREELRQELYDCICCLSGGSSAGHTAENGAANSGALHSLENVSPPVIGSVFDFRTETIEALKYLKSGESIGKVVLDNGSNELDLDFSTN